MRKWMVDMRVAAGLSLSAMAIRCGVSQQLLGYLEDGYQTLPPLAIQVGDGYGMSNEQVRELARTFVYRHDSELHPDEGATTVYELDEAELEARAKRMALTDSKGTPAAAPETRAPAINHAYRRLLDVDAHLTARETTMLRNEEIASMGLRYLENDKGFPIVNLRWLRKRLGEMRLSFGALGERCGKSQRWGQARADRDAISWRNADLICAALSAKPTDLLATERTKKK